MRNLIIALSTVILVGAGVARADDPNPAGAPTPAAEPKPADNPTPAMAPKPADGPIPAAEPSATDADKPAPAAEPAAAAAPTPIAANQPSGPPADIDTALIHNDLDGALKAADQALASNPDDAWLQYARGCALASLGRTKEALGALSKAERLFTDDHSKGLAIWRRGIALEEAGNCEGARREFKAYEATVGASDQDSLALADRFQNSCATRGVQVARKHTPVKERHTAAGKNASPTR